MPTAQFPDQKCASCGQLFTPQATEIKKHPTRVGPRGGAVWVHADQTECRLNARTNPRNSLRMAARRLRNPVSPDNYFNKIDANMLALLSGSR